MNGRATLVVLILVPIAVLVLWSIVLLASISQTLQSDELGAQLKWIAVSCVVGAVFSFLPFRWILAQAPLLYLGGVALLIAVLFGGKNINGSSRWLVIGGFSLQPSEVMKFAYLLALARALRFADDLGEWRRLIGPASLMIVPMGLVLVQPNLSTATLFLPTTLGVIYAAGAERRHLTAIVTTAVVVVAIGAIFFLAPYQKDRILSTVMRGRLSPAEQQREGYQLEQALRSLGSGGLTGAGYAQGTQNRMNRLAFRHNDFIFAVAGEEWGTIGCATIIFSFVGLVFIFLRVAYTTRDNAGRLFVVGAAILVGAQSFVHVGVNVGLIPTTGMTLPFVSAGGSSLMTFAAVVGTVISIARRRSTVLSGDSRFEQIERLRSI